MSQTASSISLVKRLFGGSGVGTTVLILLVFYVILVVVFSFLSPFFMTVRNMTSISSNIALIGLMAAAGTPLIIAGGLDLSVAAVAGLTGVIIALLHAAGIPIWVAVLAAIAVAMVVGVVNGIFATYLRLNPLIVTLATMSIVTGVSLILTDGLTKPLLVDGFNWVGQGRIADVPVPAILMILVYIGLWLMMQKTHLAAMPLLWAVTQMLAD